MSRIDEIADDVVKAFMEDPERLKGLEEKKDAFEEADANLALAQTERPRPKVRVCVQDTKVHLQIPDEIAGEMGIQAKRHVKLGTGLSGLAFVDVRGSSTYLAQLWDALMAVYRFELMKQGYYPKPGAKDSVYGLGFNMWAEDIPPLGEFPENRSEARACLKCEDGRVVLDPDVILKCDSCGDGPLGVVYTPREVWDRFFAPKKEE